MQLITAGAAATTSRRAMLAGAAAIAFTVPAVAAIPNTGPDPDAELLELGRRFDRQAAVALEEQARFNEVVDPIHDEVELRASAAGPGRTVQYATILRDTWREMEGPEVDAVEQRMHAAFDLLDATVKAILPLQPATLAGLAVKAQTVAYTAQELWSKPAAELDWGEKHTRALVEAALEMAGHPKPVEMLPILDQEAAAA